MISLYLYIDHDSETTPGLNIKPRDESMGENCTIYNLNLSLWVSFSSAPPVAPYQ